MNGAYNSYAYRKGMEILAEADMAFMNLNKALTAEDVQVCRSKYENAKYYLKKIRNDDVVSAIDRCINALDSDFAGQGRKIRDLENAQYQEDLIMGLLCLKPAENETGFMKNQKDNESFDDYELEM